MSTQYRRIIHVDLDAFFCSVEELLDPSIRGKPIVVGADPLGRGVVAAASYAARTYSVHSAMPIGHAARLCPHAVFLRPRHAVYAEHSRRVMALLGEYTPLIEQISIDEAFLDVTGSEGLFGSVEDIGHAIQRRVQDELGLPCTVGIAANKLVAKIASESGKPRGFVVVPPGKEASFLAPLDVGKLWGVGPRTGERLRAQGIGAIGDLARVPIAKLRARFGRMGEYLHQRANGADDSPVEPDRRRKSISQEHTFSRDTADPASVVARLMDLCEPVARILRREGLRGRTITLKLRYADFTTVTRSHTIAQPAELADIIYLTGKQLLEGVWRGERMVRLIGIGVSNLVAADKVQLGLFDSGNLKKETLARTVDSLRQRFGENIVRRGGTTPLRSTDGHG